VEAMPSADAKLTIPQAARRLGMDGGDVYRLVFRGLLPASPEPVEQQPALPGVPPVEPGGELVEVGLQMPRVDRALVGAQQPALEQAGHPVHPGHGHVGRIRRARQDLAVAGVAGVVEAVLGLPAVGAHRRAGLDRLADEGHEAGRGAVGDVAQPSTAEAARTVHLHRDGHDRLRLRLPARHAGLLAADVTLVDLDIAGEAVAVGAHHRRAQPMQHRPRGLIAAQPQHSLQPQRAGTVLLRLGQILHRTCLLGAIPQPTPRRIQWMRRVRGEPRGGLRCLHTAHKDVRRWRKGEWKPSHSILRGW